MQHLLYIVLHGPFFSDGKGVDMIVWRHDTWKKVNSTVIRSVGREPTIPLKEYFPVCMVACWSMHVVARVRTLYRGGG